nr:YadA-like family protein [Burkholderia cenocepacia]
MNKTYRTVWNPTTGTWVAAAETARARKKSNSTMRSSVTAAVAVMAGVGGGGFAVEAGAQTAANGNGALALCGATTGIAYGSGYTAGTSLSGCNSTANNDLYQGRLPSFGLYNSSTATGTTVGPATLATAAGVSGSKDGHLVLLGGSGVHVTGPADFANNVSMTNNRIQNLAAGTAGTDAVNVNQLNAAIAATDDRFVAIHTGTYAADAPASAGAAGSANSATAIGANASATAVSAVALGGNTVANANNGVALGTLARATAAETTAVGVGAAATGQNSSALGRGAAASGNNSTAVGTFASAAGVGNLAVGSGAAVAQTGRFVPSNMIAIGTGARAVDGDVTGANGSIAIGNSTTAAGTGSTVIGANARHSGSGATVLGGGASAMGGGAGIAVGYGAMASGSSGVSVGTNSTASAASSIALGTNSVANRANAVSVGSTELQRQITNVAAGTAGTDAVNVTQLNAAIAAADDPYVNVRAGTYAPAVAAQAGNSATAIGANASATGISAIALGGSSMASADNAVALGTLATATGVNSVAAGVNSHANANNTVALGSLANAGEVNATAVGNGANASARNAIALGQSSSAGGAAAIGIGFRSNAQADNSVALGVDSVANRNNTVSVGSATLQRQITNVAAGTDGTDAVNVDQLKKYVADNAGTANPLAVAYDDDTKGKVTLAGGTDGTTLSNVKAGVADKDAVNVAQLKGSGLIGDDGKAIAAVTYDRNTDGTPNYRSVTLGDGTNPTQLKHVANATEDSDALNLGQLKDSGLVGDDGSGNLTSLAVTYDSATKDKVTLGGGTDGTTLSNVKAGVADKDAVNVSQLKGSGLIGDDGKAIAAVTYDRNTDGTPNLGSVTLAGGADGTTLKNVKAGVADKDAVNVSQLKGSGLIGDDGSAIAAVTYDSATKDKVTLAGGTNGTTLSNVKAGVADKDAVNVAQLKGSGLIGDDGSPIAAVTYNRNADGTPNYNAVTLGGGKSAGPVTLSNVAAGVAATDAVNVQQLQQTVVNGNPYIGGRGTGVAAQATGLNAIALGLGSVADEIRTVSVGNSATGLQRRITNVQNGEADSDAATVGQVNDLMGVASTNAKAAIDNVSTTTQQAIQDVNSRLDAIGTLAGTDPYVQVDGLGDGSDNAFVRPGTFGVAIGAEASATGDTSIAIGAQSSAAGSGAVALGGGASAAGTGAVALGHGAAIGTNALALGNGASASGNNAIAEGFNARATGVNGVALGNTARANAADSLAFGTSAQVDPLATNSIAIGRQSSVTGTALNSVALGASSVADRLNSVSVGSTGQQRQIIYVARGTANTDAVNVSQLKEAVAAFGGNAAVGADGSIVNPTYTIGGTTYRNVGDALDALANLGGGGGTDPLAVTYGKNSDGTPNFEVVTLKGTDGTTLTNVKAGVADKDAVNVSQLKGSGLIGDDGKAIAAVTYDRNTDGTSNYGSVTLAGGADGTTLKNVKAGVADKDAVNVSQLKGSGLIGDDGKAIAAVTYDRNTDGTPNYRSVTLGDGTNPTQLKHVADATEDSDALNLGQLKDAGLVGDDGSGNLTSLAVTYDSATKDKVTLGGGTDGTTLANVKAGVADKDAVNVSQLKGSGLIGDDGKSIAAVTYNRNTDGTPNYNAVTLGGGKSTGPVTLSNVADGVNRNDAVNLGQLQDSGLVTPVDPTNPGSGVTSLAVTYSKNADGSANFDEVKLKGTNGTTLTNVKAGVADADAVNVSQLKGSGLIGDDGKSIAAVTYDRNTDGTPNYGSVTLGDGTNPTQLKHVANAKEDSDALNLGQLKSSGLVGDDGNGNLTSLAVTYDSTTKDKVTLGGGTDGTTLTNVKAGVADKDAVNVSQLKGSGLIGDDGKAIAAVTYDRNTDGTPNYGSVTLAGGADGTTLKNVKAGVADKDAVNVSQLKGSGLIGDDGKAIAAVTYDRNTDGTPNYRSVTLGDGTNPTQLKHVADATEDSDALNLGQLKDAGLVGDDGSGNLTSLAVTYDSATKDKVTLGGGTNGTTLTNVKAGVADADAVNVSQLKGSGLIGDDGKAIAAVTYNRNADGTPNYNAVTLGGGKSTGPVTLSNVADGVNRNDAVNLGQLQDSGLVTPVDPTNPGAGVTSLAVTYSKNTDGSANFDEVKLKGTNGTTLANVKAGVADADAVNVSQLKGSGLIGDDGKAIAAVTYDRNTDGTPNYNAVTLGAGKSTGAVQVKNVAAGTDDTDAVNVAQLKDAGLVAPVDPTNPGAGLASLAVTYGTNADGSANFDEVKLKGTNGTTLTNVKAGAVNAASTDAVNGSQLYGVSKSVADSLGGGSAVDANGNVTAPTYSLTDPANAAAKVDYRNVGDALDNLDGRVATNTQNITVINNQLADSGLVDPVTGQSIAAVTYDRKPDGTPNYNSVTLGGGKSTGAVQLKNVAAGTDDTDAVNVAQLKDAGLVAPVDPTNPGAGVTSLAVTYSQNADESADFDEVKLKGADGTTLTNVKAGAVNATSTDAINGSQLHGTAQSIADTIGGGTTVGADGRLANTAIDVHGQKYSTVEQAIQAAAAYGATDSLAVRYDLNSDGTPNFGSVTLGGTGAAPVKLTNVADGTSQYDAVNFGQLSALNDKIGDLDDRVGGLELRPGDPGNGGGTGTNPYFGATDQTAGGSSAANPGTGTGNVAAGSGSSVGTGANDGTAIGSGSKVAAGGGTAIGAGSAANGENATAIGQGSNATGSGSVAIGSGSVANEANTVSFGDGSDTGNRRIVNIADGINANDAATKGQLDRAVGGLAGQINDVSRNAYSGIAAATALTMIPGVDPGKTLSFGVGGATYKGYQAVAFGGEARITQNLKMKAGVGLSSGGNTVGVGASYQW